MSKHSKDKIWSDAVRRAVMRRMEGEEGKPQKIERLADSLVEQGLAGDIQAIKEIGDRLDGKPKQENDVTVRNGDLSDLLQQIREAGGDLTDDAGRTDGAPEVTH